MKWEEYIDSLARPSVEGMSLTERASVLDECEAQVDAKLERMRRKALRRLKRKLGLHDVGYVILKRAKALGIYQKTALADFLGIERSLLYKYLRGQVTPSRSTMDSMSEKLWGNTTEGES